MRRLYEPAAYDTARWPDSHWRATAKDPPRPALQASVELEAAVVGAGYAGLSAALALAERGVSVAVLEAGQPGWGASGRNGGFCSMGGSKLSDLELAARFGRDEAVAFRRYQREAVAHVAETLAARGIDAEAGPQGSLCLAHTTEAFAALRDAAEAEKRLDGEAPRVLSRDELAAEGLATPAAFGGALHPVGFPLHPMKYVLGLAEAAERAGAAIHAGTAVTGIQAEAGGWRLATSPGPEVRARRVLVATNGYSSDDLPPWIGGRTLPALSTIITTRPLSPEDLAAQGWTSRIMAYDSRKLLHYFRLLPDGRFLFGMRGGLSLRPGESRQVARTIRRNFAAMFPAWAGVEIEREWSGLVCLTGALTPFAGPVPGAEGLHAAFGWHGNGVSTASWSGHLVGRMMAGESLALPAPIATPPRRFPLPALRRPLMRLAYAWYGWKDGPIRAAQSP
jgi:glycine/D-amino acid oxidase-like deaminating enzyme